MTKKREKIYLILTPDAGPYNAIRHLFPGDRIPVMAPYPSVIVNDFDPCFLIDNKRLKPEQRAALIQMLLEKYRDHPEMNLDVAKAQVEEGLPIAQKWRLRIEGDPDFASVEAQQWAFEFSQLSDDPSIDLKISPLAAWCIVTQLQLAARHPANTGVPVTEAKRIAVLLAECLPLSEVGRQFLDKGWNPDLDVTVNS